MGTMGPGTGTGAGALTPNPSPDNRRGGLSREEALCALGDVRAQVRAILAEERRRGLKTGRQVRVLR